MKKLLLLLAVLLWPVRPSFAMADPANAAQDTDVYFRVGPLELNIPLKTVDVVYLFNGLGDDASRRHLVGGETTIFTAWQRLSGTVGVVTSAEGNGALFFGADVNTGNALDRFIDLGPIRVGGFGAWDSRAGAWMAGPKVSLALW